MRISRVARYGGASFTPPRHLMADADTVAAWLFDEGTGATAEDGSVNGLDGIIRNATWVASTR